MALVSPGVEVNVIDESFYTPAAAGTVPMIFVASASNKTASSGVGTAVGTLDANAGRPYLIASQRELGETFGDPLFYSDNNGNMIHGGELNEYGLQTAYSLLGVTNRVYVCRADLDLSKLQASATAPGGEPSDGAYWFDTQVSAFGLLEWNGAALTDGGQAFSSVEPVVITELSQVTGTAEAPGAPKESVGAVGDYAVVAISTLNTLWYKNTAGTWVGVGSADWKESWPVVRGTEANPALTTGNSISLDGAPVTLSGTTVADLANSINGAGVAGVTAAAVDGAIEIYSSNDTLTIANGTGTILTATGLTAGEFATPAVAIGPHTQIPEFKLTDTTPRPTGAVWLKTTVPNGGANFRVKIYNGDTQLWQTVTTPVYQTNAEAIFNLDKSGGGANLAVGDLYVKANVEEDTDKLGTWKIFRRSNNGATTIVSPKVTNQLTAASDVDFVMAETKTNSATFAPAKTVTFTASGASSDADNLAGAINAAGFTNVVASVDGQNRVVISHKLGGEINIVDTNGTLGELGFAPYVAGNSSTTANLYRTSGTTAGIGADNWTASNWKVLTYTATPDEPLELTADGELWYNSIVDEVDIMIHNGSDWVGYQNFNSAYVNTNPTGPIISATEPTEQSDGSSLVDGDLWIDTADIENYPTIYRYNGALLEWILVDKTDQTTEFGILFADARWSDAGSDSAAADIVDLLTSNFKDPDAPDPALYPKGMLLWNLRRSGFNVKRFVRNYIDVAGDNGRFPVTSVGGEDVYDAIAGSDQSMADYYPHRWVTASGNNEDGSGTFGRHAQRKVVVQALQALVNSNQEIRDEETRQFNLIAAPGYPELIGEMVTLNYDRRLTAFVVGDSPARLTPDSTSLNEWASNVRLAVEDNDDGAVSFDEYLGMYYPWGFTSDNAGNNVVVPPSHMALRTLVLNDQVAFPWFAPAGTRRGGVTNATASGYINAEGEFVSVALNTGQRDTLYANAINPITFLSGAGLVVYGQKTRARNASALDRVNVARLVVYMRGQLEKLARPYLFEPNDKITRDQIKAAADAFCLELVSLRGLYDFLVVCDESNNTPSRIDRNELYLDIAIEPVKAIEFIYIPLRIKNTGEIAALG